jgi:hypothetical protein
MKTGRYSAEEQRQHDEVLAKMAVTIRLRPDLTYPQIAQMYACSESMVQKVVRMAGLTKTRPKGRRKRVTVQVQ